MARAEFGSAKYQAKQLKASGLQKLKFYCQICEKQCRDANGFKNHLNSPSHKGKVEQLSENGSGRSAIEKYSSDFSSAFLRLLKINHGTKKINANKFYQEYILSDRDHVHMNSTKWGSLTQYVKHIGSKGLVKVEIPETEEEGFNLMISLVDTTSNYYKKQQLLKEKNRKSDDDITQRIIEDQIRRGKELEKERAKNVQKETLPKVVSSGPIKMSIKRSTTKARPKASAFGGDSDGESD